MVLRKASQQETELQTLARSTLHQAWAYAAGLALTDLTGEEVWRRVEEKYGKLWVRILKDRILEGNNVQRVSSRP